MDLEKDEEIKQGILKIPSKFIRENKEIINIQNSFKDNGFYAVSFSSSDCSKIYFSKKELRKY